MSWDDTEFDNHCTCHNMTEVRQCDNHWTCHGLTVVKECDNHLTCHEMTDISYRMWQRLENSREREINGSRDKHIWTSWGVEAGKEKQTALTKQRCIIVDTSKRYSMTHYEMNYFNCLNFVRLRSPCSQVNFCQSETFSNFYNSNM